MPFKVLLFTIPLEFYAVHMLDSCVTALSAIYANMTLNQYANV